MCFPGDYGHCYSAVAWLLHVLRWQLWALGLCLLHVRRWRLAMSIATRNG